MERKEIGAILEEEFEDYLKQNGLYEKFKKNEITCFRCSSIITKNNIAVIFYKDGIQFCCNEENCLEKYLKGAKNV